jgi:hypothetical protein
VKILHHQSQKVGHHILPRLSPFAFGSTGDLCERESSMRQLPLYVDLQSRIGNWDLPVDTDLR